MQEIKRVLIHPRDDIDFGAANKVWDLWLGDPSTHVIPHFDFVSLEDVTYLEQVRSQLVVGGQAMNNCVEHHLKLLAAQPRVKSGEVQLAICWPGVEPADESIVRGIIQDIYESFGVQVLLGMYVT